ncbi:MAG: hypothetical protein OEY81_02615 [Candidatus Bathyarchaeota archaeon]|nr:hypothetical protein [Candidatus Bathyarchaeota archaeon]MDH5690308.1 hypothetical protein [Candidatus Bathyarchaeota archaeon]
MVTIWKFEREDGETVATIANEAFEEDIAKDMPGFTAESKIDSYITLAMGLDGRILHSF